MRFAVRTLVACLVVGITADFARAELVPTSLTGRDAFICVAFLIAAYLVPLVVFLTISFAAKKSVPPPRRRRPPPSDPENARDDP
jgi:hypothetical protein